MVMAIVSLPGSFHRPSQKKKKDLFVALFWQEVIDCVHGETDEP
jgi:hypothetical protein